MECGQETETVMIYGSMYIHHNINSGRSNQQNQEETRVCSFRSLYYENEWCEYWISTCPFRLSIRFLAGELGQSLNIISPKWKLLIGIQFSHLSPRNRTGRRLVIASSKYTLVLYCASSNCNWLIRNFCDAQFSPFPWCLLFLTDSVATATELLHSVQLWW